MLKISVSFKKSEIDLYNFIISKRSYSNYVKDLLEREMIKEKGEAHKEEKRLQNPLNNWDL